MNDPKLVTLDGTKTRYFEGGGGQTLDPIQPRPLKAPTLNGWGPNDPSAPVKLGMDLPARWCIGAVCTFSIMLAITSSESIPRISAG